MHVIVGHSDDVDSADAAAAVIESCRSALAGRPPGAGILMVGADYEHATVVDAVARAWPGMPLIGCTSDGEFTTTGGFAEDSVALTIFTGDRVTFAAGQGRPISTDPEGAGRQAAEAALSRLDGPPRLCVAMPDGLTGDLSRVVGGLRAVLGDAVPIVGGSATDRRRFRVTRQFFGGEVASDTVPVLLFGGDLKVSVGVVSGWSAIGARYEVTRSAGTVVHEIDGRPAVEVYRRYIGDRVGDFFGEFPLAVHADPDSEPNYLRAVFDADPVTGALMLAGAVPVGSWVSVTHAGQDDVLAGTRASIEAALAGYPGQRPSSTLAFSCGARKWVLGTRAHEELAILSDTLRQRLGDVLPLVGYYAYGEIAPLTPGGPSHFHNETCVAVVLGTE